MKKGLGASRFQALFSFQCHCLERQGMGWGGRDNVALGGVQALAGAS